MSEKERKIFYDFDKINCLFVQIFGNSSYVFPKVKVNRI
jgi:hypothetical protein